MKKNISDIEVPPVRVTHFNYETEEQEQGTVIDQSKLYYIVIPDYNLEINVRWRKLDCDVLNGKKSI